MGGGDVNQGAQAAEQANQQKAQTYAAQQQQAALTGVNNWTAANKPPGQTAAPVQGPPQLAAPATMGGGNIVAGAPATGGMKNVTPQPMQPQGARPMPPPGGAPAQNPVALNPAQKAHIMALIGTQGH